ncbi:MAG: hypothetical protein R3D68_01170 [Hyphomicrobiaceae bacterium]
MLKKWLLSGIAGAFLMAVTPATPVSAFTLMGPGTKVQTETAVELIGTKKKAKKAVKAKKAKAKYVKVAKAKKAKKAKKAAGKSKTCGTYKYWSKKTKKCADARNKK